MLPRDNYMHKSKAVNKMSGQQLAGSGQKNRLQVVTTATIKVSL